jgi:rubrerythrin
VTNITQKTENEKFCSECAAVIRKNAEICPKCGVRQAAEYRSVQAQTPGSLTCAKCGSSAKRGSFPAWTIVLAILLFPIGLLFLLVGREPTRCPSCQNSWQS